MWRFSVTCGILASQASWEQNSEWKTWISVEQAGAGRHKWVLFLGACIFPQVFLSVPIGTSSNPRLSPLDVSRTWLVLPPNPCHQNKHVHVLFPPSHSPHCPCSQPPFLSIAARGILIRTSSHEKGFAARQEKYGIKKKKWRIPFFSMTSTILHWAPSSYPLYSSPPPPPLTAASLDTQGLLDPTTTNKKKKFWEDAPLPRLRIPPNNVPPFADGAPGWLKKWKAFLGYCYLHWWKTISLPAVEARQVQQGWVEHLHSIVLQDVLCNVIHRNSLIYPQNLVLLYYFILNHITKNYTEIGILQNTYVKIWLLPICFLDRRRSFVVYVLNQ